MRKPSKKIVEDSRRFLQYVYQEGHRLSEAMDPEREGPGEDESGLLGILTRSYTGANYGLGFPIFNNGKQTLANDRTGQLPRRDVKTFPASTSTRKRK